ncbi:unnamed protein product [Rotaria sp. Silwood2]|nr:unnamed protein product [Rotaria sp. Silwood2]CAF4346836.1 unnamed protein product [Rotaria sp. Silwood2]
MQKLSLTLVCSVVLLFSACKKESLVETQKQAVNSTNQATNQTNPSGTTVNAPNGATTSDERLQCATSISSNFNGTSIGAGKFICFTVPDAIVTIDPLASTATTSYNGTNWTSPFPKSVSGNVFLSAAAFQVPAGGLPGGINPVTWSGSVSVSDDNVKVAWQWAASVYNSFSSDLSSLGVKPCDDNKLSTTKNSDHAGTPESFKQNVAGGARGGGGSNYTGSYSSTKSFSCVVGSDIICPIVSLNLSGTSFCGAGTYTGNISTNDIWGDIKKSTTTINSIVTPDGISSYTTFWTFDGQTVTGNSISIPVSANTNCGQLVKPVLVKVVCDASQAVLLQTQVDLFMNPVIEPNFTIDQSSCTGNIAFNCLNVNDVSWTLGIVEGTGNTVPVSSIPTTLNYSYNSYGCVNTATVENVFCASWGDLNGQAPIKK